MTPTRSNRRFGLWTSSLLRVFFLAAVFAWSIAACVPGYDPAPGIGVGTQGDTVDGNFAPEFAIGPIQRLVRLTVPKGALDEATGAGFSLALSTLSPQPFPEITLSVGEPVDDTLIVDSVGQTARQFEWALPVDCDNGCELVVPIAIEQTGAGATPSFVWQASFQFEYSAVGVPDAADDMTAVIEQP